MKFPCKTLNRQEASALVVTMALCWILGFMMISYLSLIDTQNFSVSRAQAWNKALVVAEAGVEEAMSQLNSGANPNNLAVNSWTSLGTNTATVFKTLPFTG